MTEQQTHQHPVVEAALDGKQVIVVYGSIVRARQGLNDMMRALAEIGIADTVVARVTPGDIRFANGARVRFIGGDRLRLEQQLRGLSVDVVWDPGQWLDDRDAWRVLVAKNGTYNGRTLSS